ncbi:MAG: Trm112 family protein [Planctomycetota bacterium]
MPAPQLDKDLLAILACPETKTPVALADEALVGRVNAAISAGKLRSRDGQAVTRTMEAALLRQDKKVLYPVRGGIPIMLIDESIQVDALGG